MTGPNAGHQGRLGIDGALLRRRLAAAAASMARTEDQVAETLERMALALPEDAMRLQAQAERARRFATLERDRATSLGLYRQPRQASPLATRLNEALAPGGGNQNGRLGGPRCAGATQRGPRPPGSFAGGETLPSRRTPAGGQA